MDAGMGLNARFLQLMIWLKSNNYIHPGQKVVEIGAQQLNNSFLKAKDEIVSLSCLFDVPAPSLPLPVEETPDHLLAGSAPRAGPFYRSLGFEYACIDIDDDPGSIALDLNVDTVPDSLAGKFNLITNFGTTEHVVNQLNAFKIVHDLAAPGAIMLHELPAFGQTNHGFFGYQPKFFDRLSRSNDYSILILDFSWSDVEYGLPDDLRNILIQFVDTKKRPQYGSSPSAITVILRKNRAAPFIPPIDVPYGSAPPNPQMEQRYGPAFRPLPYPSRVAGRVLSAVAKVRRHLKN
jgi:hypothetical protein